ncbi:phosphatidylinositol 3,4,5-trisphosphate 5-phosphatase 2-like isoform X3 [Actinia tenebrosa]|uniref:phosphatidylinositol-3,4,5-trisphosphate 5-phosphatase n=1 Tax=Actinia tenebrosa TaxID=6105 RepID=A0A6P8IEI1_ACTTE|nr:phosphatidylinositol 3,4,5-trisphosphate 5-phosphatase 2-like isoform X3 [Actinia tenebrosa]
MSGIWYHQKLNRLDTEKMLLEFNKDGSFLIRDSESVPNAFVLSLLFQGHIHHYRIFTKVDGRYYMQAVQGVENHHFDTLGQIVNYYSQPVRGLPCQLSYPYPVDTGEDEDSDEEEDDDLEENEEPNNDQNAAAQAAFKRQMSEVKSEKIDQDFKDALGYYLGEPLLKDLHTVANGGQALEGFQKLLVSSSQDLMKDLALLISRLSFLQEVFSCKSSDNNRTIKFSSLGQADESMSEYEKLCRLLADSIAGVSTVHTQALKSIEYLVKIQEGTDNQPEKPQNRVFEVSEKSVSFRSKSYLSVDYIQGRISFLKNERDAPETGNTIDHSKITQLIKSRTNIKRLSMKIESKPIKEFEFDDGKSREVFCQLVQQVKNQNSKDQALEQISVFVGTWNMGDASPPENLSSWYKCQGHGSTRDTDVAHFAHDIYAIGTQECSYSESNWISKIKNDLHNLFDIEFKTVGVCSLWGIRIVILVKIAHQNLISHVQQSSVKTGLANALGNKGAVGISFMFSATSLCFINCHLAARSTRVLRRNQNYHDILKGLNLGQKNVFDLTNQFNHVFWFGDLNYRIDLQVMDVLENIKTNNLSKMREYDQLKQEIQKGNVFVGFKEEQINFLPTYRHKRGGKEYVWEKTKRSGILINVPSWCDRVLCHSFPDTKIACTSYGCTENIRTSDHWPVFSTFDVGIVSQYAAKPEQNGSQSSKEGCEIIFHKIEAKIKTNSKPLFVIEFHSSCLEKMGKSNQNSIPGYSKASGNKILYASPEWGRQVLPKLYPIIPDRDYLQNQHLLLAIKSVDSDESYGECCISLKAMIADTPQTFTAKLTHSGEETGSLSAEMHVKLLNAGDGTASSSRGLIKEDDDGDVNMNKLAVKPGKAARRKSCKVAKGTSLDIPVNTESRFSGHSVKDRDPAPLPKARPRSQVEGTKAIATPGSHADVSGKFRRSGSGGPPPPLPAKRFNPQTVMELLERIKFTQYYRFLVDNGYDRVDFLKGISEDDLEGSDIPPQERQRLVSAIRAVVKNLPNT